MYRHVSRKLERGELVILDGGTGTDIQRRGVAMDGELWCAMANLAAPDVVRAVHRDYIEAGAEIVIANTYASSPLALLARDRLAELEVLDEAAVALARQAVAEVGDRPVAVAGSVSVMPAIERGTDSAVRWDADEAVLRPLYRRKVQTLAAAGCDLLIMEMMRDTEVSLWATEEAVASGLPVWVGIAVDAAPDGRLVGHEVGRDTLGELTRTLMATGAEAALVMHTRAELLDEALAVIRANWDGPFGAYPESGHFEMPDWIFHQTTPDAFVADCRRWRAAGAGILGGCCGITPEHIRALGAAGLR